jgi:hypothetical protein
LLADTYLVNNCPVCCISWPCICVPLSCWLFITCSKRKCGSCGAEFSLCCWIFFVKSFLNWIRF